MSRFILTALAGVVLLTGCPALDGGNTSGQAPGFTTQASVTLSLTGAALRVDRVETALFQIQGDTEVAIPESNATIAKADLPKTLALSHLKGNTTYRLQARAYDAAHQELATNSATVSVGKDTPPASQSLALTILEVPFVGSISHP